MAKLEIHRIPARSDNYFWLAHEPESGACAVIDPGDAAPVNAKLEELGLSLTHILNTHHHGDHTGGNLELKERWGVTIVGSRADRDRIPGIDVEVGEGDSYQLGSETAQVMDVTGHTLGHIAYWFEDSDALFCGDTLFAMGCGRLSEGTAEQMVTALGRFADLPDTAQVYCAHEYTQTNARFALTVDPDNPDLRARAKEVDDLRARDIATVPSTMGEERATNPFLRAHLEPLKMTVGLSGQDTVAVWAEIRKRKDKFK